MKHSFTHFYVESVKGGEQPKIVAHSKDKKTQELYYKFLSKQSAQKLISDEKKLEPALKYRIVKETTTYEQGMWQ